MCRHYAAVYNTSMACHHKQQSSDMRDNKSYAPLPCTVHFSLPVRMQPVAAELQWCPAKGTIENAGT